MTFSNGGAGGEFKRDHFQRSGKDSGVLAGEVEHIGQARVGSLLPICLKEQREGTITRTGNE